MSCKLLGYLCIHHLIVHHIYQPDTHFLFIRMYMHFVFMGRQHNYESNLHVVITSPPEGIARYCFHPVCLSVCLCVCLCVCVCVCPANILVFYFSAIRRDTDLKFIQDIYRVVLNSLTKIDLHRSKVKITGTVHCF